MNDQPLSIEYISRFEDRFEAVDSILEIERFETVIRKIKRRAILKGIVVVVLACIVTVGLASMNGRRLTTAGYVFVLLPSVLLGVWWTHKFLLTPIVRKGVWQVGYESCRAMAGPGIDGMYRLEITDEAFIGVDDWQSSEMWWPCVRKIDRGPVVSCIQILDNRWIIIPRRAFESEQAYRWFVDEIDARNNAAGGVSGLIARHLELYELRCAKCKYQLHKNPDAICPECGRSIELSDFRSHTTERVDEVAL